FVCNNCNDLTLHFRKARSAVLFEEIMMEVMHRYKYNQALWFERFLANCLVEQAVPELRKEPWDIIVPVPLHPRKEKEREFNQAERLARQLSRASGIPMSKRIL